MQRGKTGGYEVTSGACACAVRDYSPLPYHRPQPLRTLDEIRADIVAWSRKLRGCWARLLGEARYERA